MNERLTNDLIALGRVQAALICEGEQRAGDGAAWEAFVDRLLSDQGPASPLLDARQLIVKLAPVLIAADRLSAAQAFWDYWVAKILRLIRVEPERLLDRWHPIGSGSDIARPHDYLTARIVQEPVVALRQNDGTARAFLNVCPHRLAELLTDSGRLPRGRIVCSYHGWCFDSSGACTNIPGQRRREFGKALDPESWGLQEILCLELGGRLYVAFNRAAPEPPPLPPSAEAEPAGRRIARLLHAVHPGYPKVKDPEVADFIRFHLRLGRVAARLERRAAEASLATAPLAPEAEAELAALAIELKQCLLDSGQGDEPWRSLLAGLGHPGNGRRRPAMLSAGAAEPAPPAGAPALPPWIYGDPELFVAEAERLVKPTWQFVGHEKELHAAGNLTWLDIVGQRIYVLRRADGSLTAGVLRDPGTRALEQDAEALARHLDPADFDLWNGFIFVRLHACGPSVAEVWENAALLEPYRVAAMEPLYGAGWYDFDVEVDYKLLWENFLELYHFPIAHKSLSRICRVVPGSDLVPLRSQPSQQCTAAERAYFANLHASASHSLEHERTLHRHADEHGELGEQLCFTMFGSIPCPDRAPITLGLTVFPDHLQAMSFIPVGPRECRIRIRSYGHPIDTSTARGRTLAAARDVNVSALQIELVEEDVILNYLCEGGTGSRLFRHRGVLGTLEVSVRDFQQSLRRVFPGVLQVPRPARGQILQTILGAGELRA